MPKPISNLGDTLQELGRLEDAEASFKQAITLNPDYSAAFNNLGVTLQELGRLEDAEASFKQAITLNPDYSAAFSNLGIVTQQELGRSRRSCKEALRQATARRPSYTKASY